MKLFKLLPVTSSFMSKMAFVCEMFEVTVGGILLSWMD